MFILFLLAKGLWIVSFHVMLPLYVSYPILHTMKQSIYSTGDYVIILNLYIAIGLFLLSSMQI